MSARRCIIWSASWCVDAGRRLRRAGWRLAVAGWLAGPGAVLGGGADRPGPVRRDLFPPEPWHNHGSCVVETPRGDLLAAWFHGSGERQADDVRIEGARRRRGSVAWSPRFVHADTPGYPDTNPALFLRGDELWLVYPTILANLWESALLKVHRTRVFERPGAPRWERTELLHVTPGGEFDRAVREALPSLEAAARAARWPEKTRREVEEFLQAMRDRAGDKLYRRLGWMTRAHPTVLPGGRIVMPLYHDGFSFSLMALSDDDGGTWRCSAPLIGGGNVQPNLVRARDGRLAAYMRDNGPPPQRLQVAWSGDRGETWSAVEDTEIPNPGSGAEVIALRDGRWLFVGNDTEQGRHRLGVWLSADEGRSWPWRRAVEDESPESGRTFGYPSVLQARDGRVHVTYSAQSREAGRSVSTIRHAHFGVAWLLDGARVSP